MNLDELQKLCDEATSGPWKKDLLDSITYSLHGDYEPRFGIDGPDEKDGHFIEADVDFIAAARTYMPLLIEIAQACQFHNDWMDKPGADWYYAPLPDEIKKALNKLNNP